MCDELELFEFFESDAAYDKSEKRNIRQELRNKFNPFDMDDGQFIKRYRLNKRLVHILCDELRPFMTEPLKSTDLSVENKVMVALSFYAAGSYQRPTGDIYAHSIAQSTVSVVIKEITKLLNMPCIQEKYVKFPKTSHECQAFITEFANKFGMPGVVGCIGCTHVAIVRPADNEKFYCRKRYYSLNVQLICNADMEIISVDANNGGAAHDAFIWENHSLQREIEELSVNESIWLLGNSRYPLKKNMMTPIMDAVAETENALYNEVHSRTMTTIERTIGLLKARFRCLLVHRALHYSPQVAASIVNACAVLHNMCIQSKLLVPELTEEETTLESTMQLDDSADPRYQPSSISDKDLNEGLAIRHALITHLWTSHRS